MSPPRAGFPSTMHISGLDLGAWITVYMGIMLVRSGGSAAKVEGEPADPRRIFSYVGYGLVVLGVIIFVVELRMH